MNWLDEEIKKNHSDSHCLEDSEDLVFIKSSKFSLYFKRLINKWKKLQTSHEASLSKYKIYKKNKLYSQKIINLISDQLYLLPLWCPILQDIWNYYYPSYIRLSSLSNNIVENWFGQLKHSILIQKNVNPSVLCSKVYKYLLQNYLEFYENNGIHIPHTQQNNKTNKKKEVEEKWEDKNKRIKRQKGFYLKETQNFGNSIDPETLDSIKSTKNKEFKTIFRVG